MLERKDTSYVTIERIMIHISGVCLFLNVGLFHISTVFSTYISDTILFEKNENTKLDEYLNIIF